MALSGEFGTSNQYIKYYFEMIENWTDTASNISNITVRVWFKRTNGYESYGTGTVYCTIAGGAYSASVSTSQKITGTPICLFEKNLNVGHNGDGTGNVDISGYISHSVVTSSSNSWGFGLTTIPRASQPTMSSTDITMGSAVTIYMNKLASFTHTVTVVFGGYTANIGFDIVDSMVWTPDIASMAPQIPSATAGIGSVVVSTYSGATLIGQKSVGFTATIPASVVPTFTSVTHTEATTSPDVKTIAGAYVQNISTLAMVINGASGVNGSTISSYKFNIDGVDYTGGATATSNPLKAGGTLTLTATITDSRGRTAVKTASVVVLAYEPPKLTAFSLERANSDGTLNAMGTSIKVTRNVIFTTLNAKNTLTITVKSKARGVSTWTTSNTSVVYTTTPQNGSVVVSTFSATTSYDFMVEFKDKFNTTISLGVVSTGAVTMSWGKTGIGIGKVWESGALDIAGDINVAGEINATLGVGPAGAITMFGGYTAPNGYLLCQGQAVSRTTYARLFTAISTNYGTGDGTTTFNLPDLRSRVPVGYNASEVEFNSLSKKGGAKTHTLTVAELPSHNHATGTNGGHSVYGGNATGGPASGAGYGTPVTSLVTSDTGSNIAHNNLQPYATVNFIIKT